MKNILPNLTKAFFFLGVFLFSVKLFATTHIITINNNFYSPSSLTIPEGDVIIFQLVGGTHPTAADNGTDWTTFTLVNPGDQSSPFTLSAGTHGYHCTFHGSVGSGMHGTITVTAATGIKSAQSSFGLTITPNPAVDIVTFNIDQNHPELTLIKITDLIGNEIAKINLTGNGAASEYRLDFSQLQPGLYFCHLYSDKGILETRKLFRTK